MAHGTTKSAVDDNFKNYLGKLKQHAQVLQNAHQGKTQRRWFGLVPDGNDPKPLPDPLLDRAALNTMYNEATLANDVGTLGDVGAVKLQIDYLAAAERAQRIQNCSMPRAFALAHARRFGQGQGNLFTDGPGGIISVVSNTIRAGGVAS